MRQWYQSAVVYQIYLRSFYDTNGDGVGDLPGVLKKLDYLRGGPNSLGVDAIWLSPFYPSPMADFGYEVADYCDVDPVFGTLDDFKRLLDGAHRRELKIIIDFVLNHTSDQHPWFKESRASRDNPKRDWYVWRSPKADGSPPNNWQSAFGGSAWAYHKPTGQYYLHSFLAQQPDLNWESPKVRAAMKQVVKFWCDLGVDGLRIDAASWLAKDPAFRDDPPNPHYRSQVDSPYRALRHTHSKRGPQLYTYLNEIADEVSKYTGRFMIIETYPHRWNNTEAYDQFYKQVNPQVSAPFNFEGVFAPWLAHSFRAFTDRFQTSLQDGYV